MADATTEDLSHRECFCHDAEWAGQSSAPPVVTPLISGRVTVYFAALLARTQDGWEASDTELDDVETLSDLTDLAREASVDEDTVLVFIEQEDAWFGVIRVEGEEDPRIFVSDAAAAARSSYGEILTNELLGGDDDDPADDLDALDLDGTEDGEPEEDDPDDEDRVSAAAGEAVPAGPVGDREILRDLGLSEKELLALDADALIEIADALGAGEVLETVR
jgi:putative tRNA adenosine deaminase-associated protein